MTQEQNHYKEVIRTLMHGIKGNNAVPVRILLGYLKDEMEQLGRTDLLHLLTPVIAVLDQIDQLLDEVGRHKQDVRDLSDDQFADLSERALVALQRYQKDILSAIEQLESQLRHQNMLKNEEIAGIVNDLRPLPNSPRIPTAIRIITEALQSLRKDV